MLKKGLFLLAAVSLLFCGRSNAAELKQGDTAPAFVLPGSDGKTYKLADFKNRKAVLVAWFPKAFTGGWTDECKSLRASGKVLRKFNVAYFAASCDDAKTNKAFAESLKLDFPILSDPGKKVAQAYGVVTATRPLPYRWTFLIDRNGKILAIEKKVKPAEHGKDLVKLLKKLAIPAGKAVAE